MKAKHTTGPWRAEEEFSGWVIKDENGNYIAEEIENGRDMGEADAKLIACTPDMLELLDFINDAINSHIRIVKDSPLHDDIRNLLRRATE